MGLCGGNCQVYILVLIFSSLGFLSERFVEELLSLIGLDGDTTGESVYNALVSKLDELEITLNRCMSVTTDGAPVIIGTHQGLLARRRKTKPV